MVAARAQGWSDFSSTKTGRTVDAERLRRIGRLVKIARLMDTAIRVPGVGIRFGADSVLGLLPVVGDASGALIGLYIVNEARRLGVPREKLIQMAGNIGIDAAVGSVPVLGDLFDVYFKSHRRNVQMILDHFGLNDHPQFRQANRAR